MGLSSGVPETLVLGFLSSFSLTLRHIQKSNIKFVWAELCPLLPNLYIEILHPSTLECDYLELSLLREN